MRNSKFVGSLVFAGGLSLSGCVHAVAFKPVEVPAIAKQWPATVGYNMDSGSKGRSDKIRSGNSWMGFLMGMLTPANNYSVPYGNRADEIAQAYLSKSFARLKVHESLEGIGDADISIRIEKVRCAMEGGRFAFNAKSEGTHARCGMVASAILKSGEKLIADQVYAADGPAVFFSLGIANSWAFAKTFDGALKSIVSNLIADLEKHLSATNQSAR